jgi:hypothetical protein
MYHSPLGSGSQARGRQPLKTAIPPSPAAAVDNLEVGTASLAVTASPAMSNRRSTFSLITASLEGCLLRLLDFDPCEFMKLVCVDIDAFYRLASGELNGSAVPVHEGCGEAVPVKSAAAPHNRLVENQADLRKLVLCRTVAKWGLSRVQPGPAARASTGRINSR